MIKDRYMRLKNKAILSPAANSAHIGLNKHSFSQKSFAGRDLCPRFLKSISADNTSSRWAMKKNITLSSRAAKAETRLHIHTFSQEHFVGPELFSKVISK